MRVIHLTILALNKRLNFKWAIGRGDNVHTTHYVVNPAKLPVLFRVYEVREDGRKSVHWRSLSYNWEHFVYRQT